jgi:hypothetical protein
MIRGGTLALIVFAIFRFASSAQEAPVSGAFPNKRVVIGAGMLLDGRGNIARNTRLVIDGSKIVGLDPKAGPVDYDLRGLNRAAGLD